MLLLVYYLHLAVTADMGNDLLKIFTIARIFSDKGDLDAVIRGFPRFQRKFLTIIGTTQTVDCLVMKL